jgi:hypothetical protein
MQLLAWLVFLLSAATLVLNVLTRSGSCCHPSPGDASERQLKGWGGIECLSGEVFCGLPRLQVCFEVLSAE